MYLRKVQQLRGVLSASIALAAARGILLSIDHTQLVQYGGHIELNRKWAYISLHRINFVKRKATTSKSKYSPEDIVSSKKNISQ